MVKNFIYLPLKEVGKYLYYKFRPLSFLQNQYGDGKIIITGPTQGIGPAYCEALIRAGYTDFLLIDEDQTKLDTLETKLKAYYEDNVLKHKKHLIGEDEGHTNQLKLQMFLFDFDESYDQDRFKALEKIMIDITENTDLKISMLVNNFAKVKKGSYESLDYKDISEMINGNINAITYMTKFVLTKMNHQEPKCAIINVGSATASKVRANGRFNMKEYQVYQATQTYQLAFTNLLHSEYGDVIDFLNDLPCTFNMAKDDIDNMGLNVKPAEHVEAVLKTLGKETTSNGTLSHTFLFYLMKKSPIPIFKFFS
ncbi:short-chain dehydrogenase reductase sdr [Stylonychia lemnae]|uniref:Short-chain dehydrogenase reductase sdr n=1 Tax=Stylonychia lemnae TaxID=5949 RepID=A0A078AM21_STYLE|nr:short-chain dehydrogenase reductase sdr [Stylonychia lemnae]|eukprot:CDW82916.1 short-chain dehydrogenase reductase sdr [Stylonychia lemnae]